MTNGSAKAAAVAWLEDRRLDLEEASRVEVAADRGDHARADLEVGSRLLVHEQVEVAAPVALLDVGQAVKGVGERRLDLGQQLQVVHRERGLSAPRPGRLADDPDDVAQVEVDRAGAPLLDQELKPPGTVDEVEEDQLPVPAPGQHAAGHSPLFLSFLARIEPLGLGPHRGDVDAVGKALGQSHGGRVYGTVSDSSPTWMVRRRV